MEPRPSSRRRQVLGALATSMLLPAISARLAFAKEETHSVSITNNYLPVRVDWLASGAEAALEPDMPIIDAHHHFYERPGWTYLLDEYLEDARTGLANDLSTQNPIAITNAMVGGKTLGAYDLRKSLAGGNISQTMTNYLTWDPSVDDLSAYTPIFASYVYNTLKYQAVSGYQGMNQIIASAWNRITSYPDGSQLPFPDATIFIADEMAINPKMQVLTAAGYYDAVVPAAKVDWDMRYVFDPKGGQVPQSQMQSNYTRIRYPGGHMGYADDVSRQQMHDLLVSFYVKAASTSLPSMTR
ncbi:hypothetical protein [Paraburkholderia sp. JHI869]|uniref:hypothetical protein n=1 Tax=Paraburkholderia sp. JHI869 TaxID=3112959 RepID=UPI00316B1D2A